MTAVLTARSVAGKMGVPSGKAYRLGIETICGGSRYRRLADMRRLGGKTYSESGTKNNATLAGAARQIYREANMRKCNKKT